MSRDAPGIARRGAAARSRPGSCRPYRADTGSDAQGTAGLSYQAGMSGRHVRGHRNPVISAEAAHDRRTEPRRYREGQLFPKLDEQGEFRIERVQLRDFLPRSQLELIDERGRFEPPVGFEIISAGADLAAAEIEDPAAPLAGAPHYLPIHEIVGGQPAGLAGASAVIRQDFVAEIEI